MPEAADLYVNSRVEDVTLDIAAFEPLVWAHGGLGGWQQPRSIMGDDITGRHRRSACPVLDQAQPSSVHVA
jgi:hypothetical protein